MAKLIADRPTVIVTESGTITYRTNYKIEPAVGGVADGTVDLAFDENKTESEISADIATAIAARANTETSTAQFTAADVIGGRI